MWQFMSKLFGNKNERELKALVPMVQRINEIEPNFTSLSDAELKHNTVRFKERLDQGEPLDDLLFEAFATVREASKRVLKMRHFDVQLIGGIILHRGAIAEMKTGEGKTLVATLPVYLNALSGKGVHVVTVNDYLAQRDADWMGQVYQWLGLSVDAIVHEKTDEERRHAYHGDVVYGTNNEMGFDYLRDNMKYTRAACVQRGFNFAIVDEVDSVLIDEARTPLIISGPSEESTEKYYSANATVKRLRNEDHFTVDEKDSHALFTEEGITAMERQLGITNLYDPENIEILHCLEQSLKAHHLFKRDVDYLVKDNQVVIIDQHTGRQMPGRRYSDGLHQALEAKEGVKIEKQSQTLASITFQNYFRMYDKLSGMTGTAETEATEFLNIYGLEVRVIPTNLPMVRDDKQDQIYRSKDEKFNAVLEEIQAQHVSGRPILVGTIAIETSEYLSNLLRKKNIRHVVLNAKYHEQESEIVAQAGRFNAVTIATNMAGRGTDIVLGGNPQMLAKADLVRNPDADHEALLAKYTRTCEAEKKQVLALGGLSIIGTERHDARRIDNQLRGRSGRQGDPGTSLFFLSLEDNLMRLFGGPRMKALMARNMEPGVPIEHRMVSKAIERAQKSVENRNFEIRKHLLEYDDVMNMQRQTFYKLRFDILNGEPRPYLFGRMEAITEYLIDSCMNQGGDPAENLAKLRDSLRHQFLFEPPEELENLTPEEMAEPILSAVKAMYLEKWDRLELEEEQVTDHERFLLLYVVDQQWKDHMRNMDYLKDGISLQGYAQKDPLIEYKKESFAMFNELMDRIDEEMVRTLIYLQPKVNTESISKMRRQRAREEKAMRLAGKEDAAKPKTFRRDRPKIGRNEPCYCGSGKKYKHCHGRK